MGDLKGISPLKLINGENTHWATESDVLKDCMQIFRRGGKRREHHKNSPHPSIPQIRINALTLKDLVL